MTYSCSVFLLDVSLLSPQLIKKKEEQKSALEISLNDVTGEKKHS